MAETVAISSYQLSGLRSLWPCATGLHVATVQMAGVLEVLC